MRISTNLAISADGKISPDRSVAGAFSGDADTRRFHELRRPCDALLVGHGTLKADNMTMCVDDPASGRQPLRCVASRAGSFDFNHPLFDAQGGPIHLLVTGQNPPDRVPEGPELHHMPLAAFLDHLEKQLGVRHLHCEGGGGLIHELASLDRIDDFHLTICGHLLFGGKDAPTASGDASFPFLASSRQFRLVSSDSTANGEVLAHYQRKV